MIDNLHNSSNNIIPHNRVIVNIKNYFSNNIFDILDKKSRKKTKNIDIISFYDV